MLCHIQAFKLIRVASKISKYSQPLVIYNSDGKIKAYTHTQKCLQLL